MPNLAASRIANRLDLRGPAYTVDAACASSLLAVDQAVGELAAGRCDVVLAGGVHHCHDITLWSVFTQLRALSPEPADPAVRPRRRRPADRRGHRRGGAQAAGGRRARRRPDLRRHPGHRRGQRRPRRQPVQPRPRRARCAPCARAWQAAGLDPAAPGALGLLEAHGTATPAGDAAELATLAEVFGAGRRGRRPAGDRLGEVDDRAHHAGRRAWPG